MKIIHYIKIFLFVSVLRYYSSFLLYW